MLTERKSFIPEKSREAKILQSEKLRLLTISQMENSYKAKCRRSEKPSREKDPAKLRSYKAKILKCKTSTLLKAV